jgi:predicted porin
MNKNIKLAVAGAVLALSASANAGIIIPAGEWTIDLNGNVNAFSIWQKSDHDNAITGGVATRKDATGEKNTQGINTGLLPSWLGVTGKTRQNDLDVEFTISLQPGVSDNHAHGDLNTPVLNRQTYVSFGDKSWGSIKLGKDIGVFASDAILNDMTLLGVGTASPGGLPTSWSGSGSGVNTTIGGIGTGYIYAAWKGQIAYTTPNFNGFQATVALTNPNQGLDLAGSANATTVLYQDRHGLEGKASYSFSGDALNGKVWVSGASYKVKNSIGALTSTIEQTASVVDIGANVNFGNVGLTGYYYTGEGVGTTAMFIQAINPTTGAKRDSDGGYIQATYILPTKTKIGMNYGKSNLDLSAGETAGSVVSSNKRYTIGAYHPLTKHLNLVAEWSDVEAEAHGGLKNEARSISTGAIMFF